MSRILTLFSLLLLLLVPLQAVQSGSQAELNHAALVVDYGLGVTDTICIEFAEESINGLELLERAGLTLVQSGGSICGIADTGCPASNCFCACGSADNCVYWSYWLQIDNNWVYSSVGAALATVVDGDVQGWGWGEGGAGNATEPPNVTFDAVCSQPDYHIFLPFIIR